MNPEELFEIEIVDYPEDYYFRTEPDYKIFNPRLLYVSNSFSKNLMEYIVDEIYEEIPLANANFKKSLKKLMLNCLFTNVFEGYLNGKVVAMPRGRSRFSKYKRVNNKRSVNYNNKNLPRLAHFTYGLVEVADATKEAGYIFIQNGFYSRKKKEGKYSRVWATKKLFEKFEKFGLVRDEQTNSSVPNLDWIYRLVKEKKVQKNVVDLIQLKNEKKDRIPFKKTKEIKKLENFLKLYNKFMAGVEVKIPLSSIFNHYKPSIDNYNQNLLVNPDYYSTRTSNDSPTFTPNYTSSTPLLGISDDNYIAYKDLACGLYRPFNDCVFTKGGRFYGAEYQSFPEELRKYILINGNKTIEADFKAMHPRMLYHVKGIEYPADPYEAVSEVKKIRTSIKVMFQMMINALNPMKALNAFEKAARAEPELKNAICDEGFDPYSLMQTIAKKHPDISEFFNSSKGIELQYLDSTIAEGVLKHFLDKRIPCLCIHDSFIVEEQYRDELVEVMKTEYRKVMGFDGVVEVG